ncbi:MAG: cobalamin-dependent protein [Candidatus Eiseniibacteriota bacterium]|nr:MAG: cobalamin-dependent protein [Candidatus Eisenbacteria bacterium]
MKILLIEPAKAPLTIGGEDVFIFESLALEYVAAGVEGHHDVKILDMRLEHDLHGVLREFSPQIVGITAYTVHVNTVKSVLQEIKIWNSQVLTVVGGHHATVVPEDFLSPVVDLVVMGEGVFAFREVVRRFEKGSGFDGIPGIAFAKGDGLARTACSPLEDLDGFPLPDRKLTARYRRHYYSEWMKPMASIRTSKGCPYRCNFCTLWKLTRGRYLGRKPERVVEELAGIEEEFVFFADDESLVDAARMKTLAALIEKAGIRKQYFVYGRSDTIARNPELLEMWRKIGLERVFVGLEFFRDEDLNYIGKGSTTDDNEKAVKILRDLGVETYASFILRPEFSREDFRALRRYCRKLRLGFGSFAVLTPFPGTDLYEEVRNRLITHNHDYFDLIHTLLPTELPLREFYYEFYQLLSRAFSFGDAMAFLRKFPPREIPSILMKSYRVRNRVKRAYRDYGNGDFSVRR